MAAKRGNEVDNGKSTTTQVVERNIEALLAHRREQEEALGWEDHLAGRIAEAGR
jgi:hypothetical protein